MSLYKYSLFNMLKEAKKNEVKLNAYFKGEIYEGLNGNTILGLDIGLFVTLMVLMLVLWIWALVVLVVWWKDIADWAKILGILGLVFPSIGPVITLLVVYISKYTGKKK